MKAQVPNKAADSTSPLKEGAIEREIPLSEKDPTYHNISEDLPSGFYFYNFNTLSIRPFTVACVAKINRARKMERIRPVAEAISACIDPDVSVESLTIPDFFALLIWQRINSYKKHIFTIPYICTDKKHIQKVKNKKLEHETLVGEHEIRAFSNLQFIQPDTAAITEFVNRASEQYGVPLYAPTVGDLLEEEKLKYEIIEDDDLSLDLKKERLTDLEFYSNLAQLLSPSLGTLAERIMYLENFDNPDLIGELKNYEELHDYGLRETVKIKCAGCGAEKETRVSFDVLTFFPGNP